MENTNKQIHYLTTEDIIKYLLNASDHIDTLISCKGTEMKLATTDNNLYEALGSIQAHEGVNINKLVKFIEVVDIEHAPKKILTHERAEGLRKSAWR